MRLTAVFFPESGAWGPTNNLIGIADVLRRRGARVVFVVEDSFKGRLSRKGFEERLYRAQPTSSQEETAGQFWKDFIRDTAPVFRRPTIEQLDGFIRPTWAASIEGVKYANSRIVEILDEVRPDVWVNDVVVSWPAVVASGVPWVRSMSCNPLEMDDPALPPVFSGYPVADSRDWSAFRTEYRRTHAALHAEFDAYLRGEGCPPLPGLRFSHESPFLNLYFCPAEVDYPRSVPLASTWHRIESCVRATDEPFRMPEAFARRPGRIIYLSLGSLGSADAALMQRLIDILGRTRHRVIVSLGPCHDLLSLHDNMHGEEFLPQASILPLVDLVITHAGNNTYCEGFTFGKPMIALPLFWDQYDNAQRLQETGFGARLSTYAFSDHELISAIERLLADGALHARLATIARRLQAHPGTLRAASLIERAARTRAPVTGETAPLDI